MLLRILQNQEESEVLESDVSTATSSSTIFFAFAGLMAVLIFIVAYSVRRWYNRTSQLQSNAKSQHAQNKLSATPIEVMHTLSTTAAHYQMPLTTDKDSMVASRNKSATLSPLKKSKNPEVSRHVESIRSVPSPRISCMSHESGPALFGATRIAMAAAISAGMGVDMEQYTAESRNKDEHDITDSDDYDARFTGVSDRFTTSERFTDGSERFTDGSERLTSSSDRFSAVDCTAESLSSLKLPFQYAQDNQSYSFCSDVFSVRSSTVTDDVDIYDGNLSFSVEPERSSRLSTEF